MDQATNSNRRAERGFDQKRMRQRLQLSNAASKSKLLTIRVVDPTEYSAKVYSCR